MPYFFGYQAELNEIIRKAIKETDEDHEIPDEDIDVVIARLLSPVVGVKSVKHLKRLQLDDFPDYLSVMQKRLILEAFTSIGTIVFKFKLLPIKGNCKP